jgi:hypothetical protein
MLTNKGRMAHGPPCINQFSSIHQPGVVIHIDDKCIFTVLSGESLIERNFVTDRLGNTAYLVWLDPRHNIGLLAQDIGPRDQFEAVKFPENPLCAGDNVYITVTGGNISTQVVEQDLYQDDPSSVRPGHHYALVRQRAEAPMARLNFNLPSDMNGYAVFDTITGYLRGFVNINPAQGGFTVADVFYLHKVLQGAIDKFQEYLKGFAGQSVSDVLTDPTNYEGMRRVLASSPKTLGIYYVYGPNDDSLTIARVPGVVDATGNLIEPRFDKTEVRLDTAASRNKKLKDDYYKYKDKALGRITVVSHTDFISGDKITASGGRVLNGGNGVIDDVPDWPVDDVLGPGDWVDTNNQVVHGFGIGRMITAIERAICRYKPGTSILLGIEWTSKTGVLARKVYQFDGLDEPTSDQINGTPVPRILSDVSSLVQINEQKYVPLITGTTYLSTTDLQAAIVTIPANTNRFRRYEPRAFLLFQGLPPQQDYWQYWQ